MRFRFSCCGQIARPRIVRRRLRHLGSYRVQDDVPAHLKEMTVLLDQDRFVPSLEQVSGPAVPLVHELSIDAVQLPHTNRKITIRGLNEEMVMVCHEAVGMADPVVPLVDMLEGIQEVYAIIVSLEDGLLLISARRDVIDSTDKFDAERA